MDSDPGVVTTDYCKYSSIISNLIENCKFQSKKSIYQYNLPNELYSFNKIHNSAKALNDIFKKIKIGNYIKPKSRVLLLDSTISFFALIRSTHFYEVESILVFDNKTATILGQIDKIDILLFIIILHRNITDPNDKLQLWTITLSDWIAIKPLNKINKIYSDTSFLDISQLIKTESLQSIYIWSTTKEYYISDLSYFYILDLLVQNIKANTIDEINIKDFNIGTFDNIISLTPDASYIQAVEILIKNGFYLIPIIDSGQFYGFFSRNTAVNYFIKSLDDKILLDFDTKLKLIIDKYDFDHNSDTSNIVQNVDMSVYIICDNNITLIQAISSLAKNCANRLIIVNPDTFELIGIITLTDIVNALTNY